MARRKETPTFEIRKNEIGSTQALKWYDDPTLTDYNGAPIKNFITTHLDAGTAGVAFGVFKNGKYLGALELMKQTNVQQDGSVKETGVLLVTQGGTKQLRQLASSGLGGTGLEFAPETERKMSNAEKTLLAVTLPIIVAGSLYIILEGPKVLEELFKR